MTELKGYPKYKESGIGWMGEIPEEWKKTKVSWLFSNIGSGGTPSSRNNKYYDNGNVNWINTGDLNDGYLKNTKNKITEDALKDLTTLKIYPENSLVIAMYGATIGKLAVTKIQATTNQACCVMSKPVNTSIKFMYYWFLTSREDIINSSSGGGQPNISQSLIKNLNVFLPDILEQDRIVSFLDNKTSEIASLISNKELLIKLLEEKRQAIITETVTKGLNPNVKMKDSGIEWIGEIPEHWELGKVKYTTYVKGRIGWQGLRSDEFMDIGPHLVTGTDFYQGRVSWDKCHRISEERYEEAPEIHLKENDLLITKDGTIGKIALVKSKPEKVTLNSGIFVTRPYNDIYDPEYFYWVLYSNVFLDFIDLMSSGSTVRHLYQNIFERFSYPLPNKSEQLQIVKELNGIITEIDNLILIIEKQINKIKKYRESLIYEAVTGKIDLRSYKGNMTEEEILD